ncbi:hypothetical protein EMIHUDRAFT_220486 [Emiliania huxleyi CCMP1516]|uniref:RING-CH-type domain-containing protein n=2 Tax=Emiliania huxleyi TaxID=2903 RepID=A0A0D3I172_EMIH1|nr:hypothetical protein EMIHUDRAFT_220486 [Emiliania huxleyi CCMP1516]EOD05007.1 hypothetical protein EMIHUDRAFT_220486 [Emiliania huxleyi CCMP1516]|eukprot:XP_005757436.1 hypothetical protein EMIHUDRAFT_220486 [Emiliania huxleyi CCMP1516]
MSGLVCRVCFEELPSSCPDTEAGTGMIQPCLCSGSARLVHRRCLDTWRSTRRGNAFTHCGTCRFRYRVVTRKAKPIELLAYRLTIARDIALLASIASCLVVLCSVIAAWLSREVEERGGTDSLAGLGIDSTTARQLTRLLLPGAGLDAPDGDSAAATGGSLSLHNPACPWSVWLGAGALLLCALLGVASILAWALGLIPDDFEVQWPRNCQCFVFAGPLVLLAAAALCVFGLVVGVSIATRLLRRGFVRHAEVAWLRDETKRHVVQDLRGVNQERAG